MISSATASAIITYEICVLLRSKSRTACILSQSPVSLGEIGIECQGSLIVRNPRYITPEPRSPFAHVLAIRCLMTGTIDLCEFMERYGDEQSCRDYVERLRWPQGN